MFPLEWENKKKGYFVLFTAEALEKMLAFRQDAVRKTEAGGVLVGFRRKPHLEIVDVTTPGLMDRRTRTRFERLDGKHQRFIRKQWKISNGFVDYLGEWHTHPERLPSPSPLDISESISKTESVPRRPILELIIGTEGMWIGVVNRHNTDVLQPAPVK